MKQIVIIGGGSIGTCTAYYLCTQHTDAHVTLVDAEADADGGAFTPPAASGRAGKPSHKYSGPSWPWKQPAVSQFWPRPGMEPPKQFTTGA